VKRENKNGESKMLEKPHKKLDVWRHSMELAQRIYRITSEFPADEKFGLVSQMRRAAVSIPSNIAEGAARQGKKEFRNFLGIARGSLSELDTQAELSVLLGYLNEETTEGLTGQLTRIDQMLAGLIRKLSVKNLKQEIKR
jgi:four helix bundle protein